MKKKFIILVSFILLVLVIVILIKNIEGSESTKRSMLDTNEPNQNILNEQFLDIQAIEQYKGKKIILLFWQIWCPPCRDELAILNNVYETLGENKKDVILLTVTKPKMDQNGYEEDKTIDEIKQFFSENKYKFPVLFDTEKTLYLSFNVNSFPTTIIIDENGNEIQRKTEAELTEEEFLELIY